MKCHSCRKGHMGGWTWYSLRPFSFYLYRLDLLTFMNYLHRIDLLQVTVSKREQSPAFFSLILLTLWSEHHFYVLTKLSSFFSK